MSRVIIQSSSLVYESLITIAWPSLSQKEKEKEEYTVYGI